jgi:uncharacterized protein (DUF1330 family)
MSAYVLVNNHVHDPGDYARYIEEVAPTVVEYGGRYLVRGGAAEPINSQWLWSRVVLVEFPSLDAARRWIDDDAMAPLHAMRNRHARSEMVILQGV